MHFKLDPDNSIPILVSTVVYHHFNGVQPKEHKYNKEYTKDEVQCPIDKEDTTGTTWNGMEIAWWLYDV